MDVQAGSSENDRLRHDRDAIRFLAHDLNSLVAAIAAMGAALEVTRGGAAERELWLDAIVDECGRLRSLVASTLSARAVGVPATTAITRLDEMVEEVVRLLGLGFGAKFEVEYEAVEVPLDKTAVWRIVMNLLDNARRAAGDDVVSVVVRRSGPVAMFRVSNPVNDDPRHESFPGNGFGQQIVAGFVRQHGGTWTFLPSEPGTVVQEITFILSQRNGVVCDALNRFSW
jgi:signal transduction histidine kinase